MMKKVLFVLHYCPPVYGSNVIGSIIKDSAPINSVIISKYIKIKSSIDISKVRKFEILKLLYSVKLTVEVLINLIVFRPCVIYYTPSVKGAAFYRDLIITILPKLYCKIFKKEILFHYHTHGINNFTAKSKLNHKLTSSLLRNSNVILVSKFLTNDISSISTYKRLFFLSNGILNKVTDDDLLEIGKKRNADDNINILFLSNLKELKGAEIAYKAFKNLYLTGEYPQLRLYFVGGYSEPIFIQRLKQNITDNGLENVVFLEGPKYDDEKTEYLKRAHIFLFPSFMEAFGLVIIEAMQFGLPVISSNEGGIPGIIRNHETGFLVEKGNVDQFTGKLKVLIENKILCTEMGAKGRIRYLENFQITNFETEFVHILNSLTIDE